MDYWTVSVVPPLLPSEAAPIVVIPEFLPVANPVASIVATVVSLLVHVTPSPTTDTGVKVSVVVPLPRRPWRPRPQHCTRPPGRSAQLCSAPDVRAMALVIPVTKMSSGSVVTGALAVYDSRGKNLAPRGASEVLIGVDGKVAMMR